MVVFVFGPFPETPGSDPPFLSRAAAARPLAFPRASAATSAFGCSLATFRLAETCLTSSVGETSLFSACSKDCFMARLTTPIWVALILVSFLASMALNWPWSRGLISGSASPSWWAQWLPSPQCLPVWT